MLYRGTKPGVLYKGTYKPGKIYKGTQLVAGYVDVSKAAPASWDGTYDDVVGVAAQGRGKQQTYSGAQLLDISTCTINSAKPYGLTITRDGDVVKIQGTAVPDNVGDLNFFVLLWAPNTDLSGKGYVITPFLLQGSIDKVYGLRTAEESAIACGLTMTEGEAVDVALRLMVSVDTPTAYEPYVGGQPSPSPDYPQPLVAAEGALTASGRNLLMTNRDTYVQSGVTVERLADGRYHISGTPTEMSSLYLGYGISIPLAAGTYTLSQPPVAESLNVVALLLPGWRGSTFLLDEATTFTGIYIDVPSAAVGQELDFVYGPQLEHGGTAHPYRPYVAPTTVTLPVLRAIPGTNIRDTLAYIGGDQWQVTRRVGVVQLTGTETWVVGGQYREDKMDWYYVSARLADAVDSSDAACACTHYRHGVIANNQTTQGVGIVWQAIRVRYGDPPDGTDAWKAFLAAQAAAGDPVTIWYALATPTTETVTLGELPSYPVHTALAVSGDYPPDVTGTVKVSLL